MTETRKSINLLMQAALFIVIFGALQYSWSTIRHDPIGNFVVEGLTVKTAVALINLFTPAVAAMAQGTHINASGGGINVVSGCEGVEVIFLLAAAMVVAPLTMRFRLIGLLLGTLVAFFLNQGRLIGMFYAYRTDHALFDILHGVVAPVLLIALTALFFSWWLGRYGIGQANDV